MDSYCYTCDYKLSCSNQPKMHHKIKHEGLRAWCQLCYYGAQNKADLAKQTNDMANISLVISQCDDKNTKLILTTMSRLNMQT